MKRHIACLFFALALSAVSLQTMPAAADTATNAQPAPIVEPPALDNPQDKFDEFAAKVKAATHDQSDPEAAQDSASHDLPLSEAAPDQTPIPVPIQMNATAQAPMPTQVVSAGQPDPFANMIVAKSSITAVTVYNNRAKVTRKAEVKVPAGKHIIAFQNLPASLLPESLRADGSAQENVTLGAISHKQIVVGRAASSRERGLQDQIEALQDQRAPLVSEKASIEVANGFLKGIGDGASPRPHENIPDVNLNPQQWAAAAQAIHDDTADNLKRAAELDRKLRDIDREIDKDQRELAQVATGQESIFTVLVPLEAEKPTTLTLNINYQVPGATWQPLYDARIATDGKSDMQLIQYGSVSQQTGEDWTSVALTLSTAQPQRSASLPPLSPMWVNGYEIRPRTYGSTYAGSVAEMNRKNAEDAKASGTSEIPVPIAPAENQTLQLPATPPPQPVEFAAAAIETGGFVSEYKIASPASVPSDGTETKLLVGNFGLDSKLQVHIKPQLSTDAYLVVHSKLKGDAPLLPGQVNLFRDGAYVGQSTLPLLRPGEEHDLYFGVDDQVAVKRDVVKDETKQSGMLSKDTIISRNYVTELQNLHSVPIDIVVKETTPVAQNEKIHADIDLNQTTPGYTTDNDNVKGLLNWQFTMQPKEKKDMKLGWSVSYPSENAVTGL